MNEIPQPLFDLYALSLPRGHGFGDSPPVGYWQSDDGKSFGVITRNVQNMKFGLLSLRRRLDHVWSVTSTVDDLDSFDEAFRQLGSLLEDCATPAPMPPNVSPRPALCDLKGRIPSDIFKLLCSPSHHTAAWILNQLYLSLPNPDPNWVSDCQTDNFHTRLWEVQLLASFREQGLLVSQPYESPDFLIQNRRGDQAWVEAVTANPKQRFNHVNPPLTSPPNDLQERTMGGAAVRFAKTLGNKLGRNYHLFPHVKGHPFAIALADFQAPASMVWSREALMTYLYGMRPCRNKSSESGVDSIEKITHLLGESNFPAGLFANDNNKQLSAIIFSNACSIAKLNRVGVSGGSDAKGFRFVRFGEFFDRTPGALKSIPFCMDITSSEYRSLWPHEYEPWCAELEVFHNPFAEHPVSKNLLPEATHWFEEGGEIKCRSHYDTSILRSHTLVMDQSHPILKIEDILNMDENSFDN